MSYLDGLRFLIIWTELVKVLLQRGVGRQLLVHRALEARENMRQVIAGSSWVKEIMQDPRYRHSFMPSGAYNCNDENAYY